MATAVHSAVTTHPLVGAPTASRGPTTPVKKRKTLKHFHLHHVEIKKNYTSTRPRHRWKNIK
jgi:hypothetical protein